MENILTMRWSNDFIRHLPYNETWWFVKPGALFWIQGRKFQKQGQNLCHQGRNIEVRDAILGPPGAGFSNYVSPGGWTCQVMHSGQIDWLSYRRRSITRKIHVAQKNVMEEKLLEIKRSIRRGIYLFQIRSGYFSV